MTDELNSTVAAGDKKIAAPLSSSTSVNTEAKSRKQRNRSSDEHNSLPSGNKHQGLNVKPRESFIFNAVMVIICVCIAGILIWVAVDGTPIDSYEDTIGLTIVFISTSLLMAIASYFGFLAFWLSPISIEKSKGGRMRVHHLHYLATKARLWLHQC
ncbi:hypothetical protein GH714_005690 [Hevea brasiliensis]|uniref:Uncharacterized protein n=1 Tax=Hevea brasiliensis TaxID=3981 RepID=A0A6A6LHA0_HEVBR|nr:hypothetical protein GH714_005690 [Hevea brasiliensis]